MATVSAPTSGTLVIPWHVTWDEYRRWRDFLEGRNVRLTYLRGRLEILSPSREHEFVKERFAMVIRNLARGMRLPLVSVGSTTFEREDDTGKEPDTSFYVGDRARAEGLKVRKRQKSSPGDPPAPDLAVEVVIWNRDTIALETYRELGVREVWWYEKGLKIYRLARNGRYTSRATSGIFPGLEAAQILKWVEGGPADDTEWSERWEGPIRAVGASLRGDRGA
jgi:Uma2 family endonuclease